MGDHDTSRHARCGMDAPVAAGAGPAGNAARAPLSCTRIVDAAVRYVDHDCLESLSMRRLGADLGVEAMSLYRYFPSKAALLDAVVDRLLADVALPPAGAAAGDAWADAVRAYARSFRAACARHPRLLPLLVTLGAENPTRRDIDLRMAGLWQAAGFEPETAAAAQTALQSYLMGSCLSGACASDAPGAFDLGLDALIGGLGARLVAARPTA